MTATVESPVKADAVGTNCGGGPEGVATIVRRFRAVAPLPAWIKPNAGLPTLASGRATYPIGPERFAEYLPEWLDAGASYIGGCCGACAEHLRLLAQYRNLSTDDADENG